MQDDYDPAQPTDSARPGRQPTSSYCRYSASTRAPEHMRISSSCWNIVFASRLC